jgi:cytochrome c-type biogenesis protein CcsB
MSRLLFSLTLASYGIATLMYLVWLLRSSEGTGAIARRILIAGCILHQLAILHRYVAYGHFQITNMHDALSFCGLAIVSIYLVVENRYKVTALGSFVTPVAFLMMLGSSALAQDLAPLDPTLQNIWIYIHTMLAFGSYALFTVSGGVAVMYLLLSHLLKTKYLGQIVQKLPSLEKLDDIGQRCLNLGFPMLTITLIIGSLVATQRWGSYWSWEPKQVWSLVIWSVYALLLNGRLVLGWRGKRAALLSLIGILLLMFGFVGINLWFPGLHNFN